MKVAPIHKAFKQLQIKNEKLKIEHLICHTGQHYDEKMSRIFFDELELPKPDYYLGIGSGSHAEQTAKIMIEFEKVLLNEKPDLIIVVGDVNSTIACSLVAAKLGIKIAHVEAGLRSFDMSMPEEINRILTDRISDYLFVTEQSGIDNLIREGVAPEKIHFVGNVMIDSLINYLPKTDDSKIFEKLGLLNGRVQQINDSTLSTVSASSTTSTNSTSSTSPIDIKPYILVTMHRPSNVDSSVFMKDFMEMLTELSRTVTVVFPIHPRTRKELEKYSLHNKEYGSLILTDPIGYIDFLALTKNAKLVITDSGGIQEETTYLGVQCITVRKNTERPVTVDVGTNHLAGTDLSCVHEKTNEILKGNLKVGSIPRMWDGCAAGRIVENITMNRLNFAQ